MNSKGLSEIQGFKVQGCVCLCWDSRGLAAARCTVERLTCFLWRGRSAPLLCRRAQHRSCLWEGLCPTRSGSLGNPCPWWTHWRPSTCHLQVETVPDSDQKADENQHQSIKELLLTDGSDFNSSNYLWRRQTFHRSSHMPHWCLKADPSRNGWWASGNPSAPCCYALAKTTYPKNMRTSQKSSLVCEPTIAQNVLELKKYLKNELFPSEDSNGIKVALANVWTVLWSGKLCWPRRRGRWWSTWFASCDRKD